MLKPISHRILTSVSERLENYGHLTSGLDPVRREMSKTNLPLVDALCTAEDFSCLEHLSDTLSDEMYFTFPERERHVNFD